MSKLSLMYYCSQCEFGYRVPTADRDRHLLQLVMPCPTKECEGSIEYGDPQVVKEGQTLAARTLYEACFGMGFPEERQCSPTHLTDLLIGSTVVLASLTELEQNRSCIEHLTVEKEGHKQRYRIFFAMSTHGATIYKIEKLEKLDA